MTATLEYPTHCPHGAERECEWTGNPDVWMTYADGCWTTSRGEGVRSIFHLDDTAFRSITLADYLAAWDEALVLNAGDELYDEAVRLNEMDRKLREFGAKQDRIRNAAASVAANTIEHWPCGCVMNMADAHRGACSEFPNVFKLGICGWCGGLAELNPTTNACEACHPDALDHADYLGEVPWTDRVED